MDLLYDTDLTKKVHTMSSKSSSQQIRIHKLIANDSSLGDPRNEITQVMKATSFSNRQANPLQWWIAHRARFLIDN